jgi:hypothetical protein
MRQRANAARALLEAVLSSPSGRVFVQLNVVGEHVEESPGAGLLSESPGRGTVTLISSVAC